MHADACTRMHTCARTHTRVHGHTHVSHRHPQRCTHRGTPRHTPTRRAQPHAHTDTGCRAHRHRDKACPPLPAPSRACTYSPRVSACSSVAFSCFRDFLSANKPRPSVKGLFKRRHPGSAALPAGFWHCPQTQCRSLLQWDINTSDLKQTVGL